VNRKLYIVSPLYDWCFFLLPPMLSLALGIFLSGTDVATVSRTLGTEEDTLVGFALGVLVHAHLVAVVFRSHGNRDIFRTHPYRFTIVPLVLWGVLVWSPWALAAATVVATFWDVWHSGAQTFGFARIYDRNAGTDPELGRRLDFWLNQLLYAGPILAGATLMDHVESFDSFSEVGDAFLGSVPIAVAGHARVLSYVVLTAGIAFLVGYVAAYVRYWRRGYRPSFEKVFLLVSTGFCSIYSWGWNSWGEAFLVMNVFHAVQYLALVWAREQRSIQRVFRLPRRPRLALALFLVGVLAYGLGVQAMDTRIHWLWAITIVVSLMHFWYDAFVWSVRKKQI
jgi:hypothetical protein